MPGDLVLPAFEMDCRDWLVLGPTDAGLPEEVAGAPVVATLSTAVIDGSELHCARATLSLCLLDDEQPVAIPVSADAVAAELVDFGDQGDADASELLEVDQPDDVIRYVLPAPQGDLALLAEFVVESGGYAALAARIDALMASFRWA